MIVPKNINNNGVVPLNTAEVEDAISVTMLSGTII